MRLGPVEEKRSMLDGIDQDVATRDFSHTHPNRVNQGKYLEQATHEPST